MQSAAQRLADQLDRWHADADPGEATPYALELGCTLRAASRFFIDRQSPYQEGPARSAVGVRADLVGVSSGDGVLGASDGDGAVVGVSDGDGVVGSGSQARYPAA